jgi:peptidoglycan/xylan/chitin deacetylase (PgdA/CDA1 family)
MRLPLLEPGPTENTVMQACMNRRKWIGVGACSAIGAWSSSARAFEPDSGSSVARVAITLDLEMARNFPNWEDTHWDYEKGNLDSAAKQYSVKAGDLVKQYGGRIHFFCVGSVLEQENVDWLKQLAEDGHPIGNHTYDHVNLLATKPIESQFRFQRAPWLVSGQSTLEVLHRNIELTKQALEDRIGVQNRGFRTPGGFPNGLAGREDLQQMLLDFGFTWVSSQYPAHAVTEPHTQPGTEVYESIISAQVHAQPFVYPTGLIEIPMSPISDIGAFRTGRWELEWFLEAIRRSLEWTIAHGAVFDFLAHPSCLGVVDPDCRTLRLICEMVQSAGKRAELVDLDKIAQHWKNQ